MATRRELLTVVDSGLIDKAEGMVRGARALPRSKLPFWKKLAPAAQLTLVNALVARGLEEGAKGALRVPASEQATSLVQGGARTSLRMAQKRFAGLTPAERTAALAEAIGAGALHVVVRTKIDTLVSGAERVLSTDELSRLAAVHESLGAVLKLQGKKLSTKGPLARVRKSLLREDVVTMIAPLIGSFAGAPRGEAEEEGEVLALLRQMGRPPTSLVWIPDLVRGLLPRMTARQTHETLLRLRGKRALELRLESGVGRLSAEDGALCPRNTDGFPLSHALLIPAT